MEKVNDYQKVLRGSIQVNVFKNKHALTDSFDPERLPFRDKEAIKIINVLKPALKKDKPRNLFICGKTGTGKTAVIRMIIKNIEKVAKDDKLPVAVIYINCNIKKVSDTEHRVINKMLEEIGEDVKGGTSSTEQYDTLFNRIDKMKKCFIVVLDELDMLVNRIGSNFLYTFLRINTELKNSIITMVGITNDTTFLSYVDGRIKSSLNEDVLIFQPYDAIQLRKILEDRINIAFHDGVLGKEIINLCAAKAAQEHGDARKALNLLWVAGEIVEEEGRQRITINDVERADSKIDEDIYSNNIRSMPKQSQILLAAIIKSIDDTKNNYAQTGPVYSNYVSIAKNNNVGTLSPIRISNLIAELDTIGFLDARVISHGRHGRTREISTTFGKEVKKSMLKVISESISI